MPKRAGAWSVKLTTSATIMNVATHAGPFRLHGESRSIFQESSAWRV